MSNLMDGRAIAKLTMGMKATKTALANATAVYFRAYTGLVVVTAIIGKVTVEAVGATTLTITHVPTAGATIPVCAAGDVDTGTIGSYITCPLSGTGVATTNDAATGLAIPSKMLLPVGALTFTWSAESGSASWTVWYIPMEDGAYMAAATA